MVSVTPQPRFTPVERTAGTHCTGDWVTQLAEANTPKTNENRYFIKRSSNSRFLRPHPTKISVSLTRRYKVQFLHADRDLNFPKKKRKCASFDTLTNKDDFALLDMWRYVLRVQDNVKSLGSSDS
jgi:hypothetical protein